MRAFLRTPKQTRLRRVVFQIHLWLGLIIGTYLLVMSFTGAYLLFVDELSLANHPSWYRTSNPGRPALGVDEVLASVHAAYPGQRVYRLYAPSRARDTYIVIIERSGLFTTTFVDPADAKILGDAKADVFERFVWEVHSNLVAGTTGRVINCTLGLAAVLLIVTGLIVWWPGTERWVSALGVRMGTRLLVFARSLHGAIGIWTALFIMLYAITGALYYYGPVFFRVLGVVSPLTQEPTPFAGPPMPGAKPLTAFNPLVAQAERASPGLRLWGLFPAWSDKSPVRVIVGPAGNQLGADDWEWRHQGNRYYYYDQYTGALLKTWDLTNPTFADQVRRWMAPFHRGSIGGSGLKVFWLLFGLAPAALFLLGTALWWTRKVRPAKPNGAAAT